MTKRYTTDNFREPTVLTDELQNPSDTNFDFVSISYGDLTDTVSDDHYPYGAIKMSYRFEGRTGEKLFIGESAHHEATRWLNDAIGWPNPFAYDVSMVLQ